MIIPVKTPWKMNIGAETSTYYSISVEATAELNLNLFI